MDLSNELQAATPLKYACHHINLVKLTLRRLGLDQLTPGLWQSRKTFNERTLKELATSLRRAGGNVIPLVVSPKAGGDGFYIISGERRWRAAQIAEIHDLLCLVGNYTPEQAQFIAAAENLQRENLNPIEEASAYADMQDSGLSHEEISKEVGKSRGHVSNYIRLLSLPVQVRDFLVEGKLSASQARPLCALSNPVDQRDLAIKAVNGGWNVRRIGIEAGHLLDKAKVKPTTKIPREDADVKRLRRLVEEVTGYPCVIARGATGSWQMGFSMNSDDQFAGLLSRLGVNVDE